VKCVQLFAEESSSGVHTDCRDFDNESFHYHSDAPPSLQDTANRFDHDAYLYISCRFSIAVEAVLVVSIGSFEHSPTC